jgi:hypothetical protein
VSEQTVEDWYRDGRAVSKCPEGDKKCEHPAFSAILLLVIVIGGIALFVVVCSVSTLVIDRWTRCRQRPNLLERLHPYQPTSVADEAQRWLQAEQG